MRAGRGRAGLGRPRPCVSPLPACAASRGARASSGARVCSHGGGADDGGAAAGIARGGAGRVGPVCAPLSPPCLTGAGKPPRRVRPDRKRGGKGGAGVVTLIDSEAVGAKLKA